MRDGSGSSADLMKISGGGFIAISTFPDFPRSETKGGFILTDIGRGVYYFDLA